MPIGAVVEDVAEGEGVLGRRGGIGIRRDAEARRQQDIVAQVAGVVVGGDK